MAKLTREVQSAVVPRLHELRRARMWTRRDLASRSDVTEVTILNAENGKPIRYATVRKLATALDVEPQVLCEQAPAEATA